MPSRKSPYQKGNIQRTLKPEIRVDRGRHEGQVKFIDNPNGNGNFMWICSCLKEGQPEDYYIDASRELLNHYAENK